MDHTPGKRLKLFILRPTMGQGGADRVTLILLQRLDRRLFDVSLVLMRSEGEFLSEIPQDVKVYSLNAANVGTAWLPLSRLLWAHKPDILFSTSSGTSITAVMAHALTRHKSRLILSERNILFHGGHSFKREAVVWLKRLLYPHADQIISLSEGVKDDLVQTLRVAPELVSVVYSPVDVEQIQEQAAEPIDHAWFHEETPIILGVGRFVAEKDFPTLIRAFAKVRSQRPARLVMLGEGARREELVSLANQLGMTENVWFAGFDKNPFKYMAKCTMFVVSSRHEGLCTVLIQAMACGAPVITTNYEVGALEIVEPGQDGLVVPVGDVTAMAAQMEYLLDHPETRQQLGKKASHSAQRFRADILVDKHVAALLGNQAAA